MDPLTPLAGQRESVHVRLEPVYNALNSLSLLGEASPLSGLNAWVVRSGSAMTSEQQHTQRLLFEGLRDVLTPAFDLVDFPAYLATLAESDPVALRDRALQRLQKRFERRFAAASEEPVAAPGRERLLSDVAAYLACVEYAQIDAGFDPALQREAHQLLNEPGAMQQLIVAHLELLWRTSLATEWRRVHSSLRWQVEMFQHHLDEGAALPEVFQTLTGRDLPAEALARISEAQEVILVPSWHTGRHVTFWEGDDALRLFFSEPPNYDLAVLQTAPVGRAELRARLAALADETRLRILELLAQQDEMSAQEIIAALELSQSSVSRHLKQLSSLGYLYERRGNGAAKTYRLSSPYFERTVRALKALSAGETEVVTRASEQPFSLDLRRFLDKHGRLCMWPPARLRDKLLVLEYLAGFFEPGRIYHEREVNEILLLHSTIRDSAALRRALYEYRFMNRTRDGSRYWLSASTPAEGGGGRDATF
jgi:DNA-binding transcriptional ArsR family regulator